MNECTASKTRLLSLKDWEWSPKSKVCRQTLLGTGDWGLNSGSRALEASTLPLGYREGGQNHNNHDNHVIVKYNSKLC